MNDLASNTRGVLRDSNIELYRIILMLLIIAHHYVVNSGIPEIFDFEHIAGNMVFAQIIGMWGKTVINCFSIITGYFMVKSNTTLKKFTRLFLQVEFYYVFFYFLFLVTGYAQFSIKEMLKTLLWFIYEPGNLYVGTYVIFYCLVPFINILIRNMSVKQYRLLLLLLITYFTVFSSIFKNETFDFLGVMAMCYLIGGYIRLYSNKNWDNIKIGAIGTTLSMVIAILSIIVVDVFGARLGFTNWGYMVFDSNKLFAVSTGISSFILFKSLKIKENTIINGFAATTFGILLFHANGWPMRNFLWKTLFRNAEFYQKSMFPLRTILIILVVFLCGAVFEWCRKKIFEKPILNFVYRSKLYNRLEKLIER